MGKHKKNKATKNNNPSVTIITITQYSRYNTLLILKDLINLQTYKNITEWVIVNGTKDTNDGKILDGKLKELSDNNEDDYDIIIVPHKEGLTLGENRNRGNKESTGDIIVCMDDDDYYPITRVKHAVDNLIKSKRLIAGCSKLYLYDYDMNALIQSKGHGQFHSTNACMAYKKEYIKNHTYASVNCGEEPSFTNNFSEQLIQLEPEHCVYASSHNNNTFNKRELITAAFIIPDRCSFIGIDKLITDYIPVNILTRYQSIFLSTKDNENDLVFLAGSFTVNIWNPHEVCIGSPEYNLVMIASSYAKLNKKVPVYGNMLECEYDNVKYIDWKKFNFTEHYKNIVVWQLSGLATFLFFNLKGDNIIVDLYDMPHQDTLNSILRNKHKINKIVFKNKLRYLQYENYKQLELNENNSFIIPFGLNKDILNKYKMETTDKIIRDNNRFCYMTNILYYEHLDQLINFVFSTIITIEPNIKLHLYYNKTDANPEKPEEILKFITLFNQYKNNLILHINPKQEDIYKEYLYSSIYFNVSPLFTEINKAYLLESLYCGCIPLICNNDLFQECPGIQYKINETINIISIAQSIVNLINNTAEMNKLQTDCLNTNLMDNQQVFDKWTNILI
jgi:hypothetical protein